MTDLWQRLKQRKLVQWALAYVAAALRDRSPVQPGQPLARNRRTRDVAAQAYFLPYA